MKDAVPAHICPVCGHEKKKGGCPVREKMIEDGYTGPIEIDEEESL